MAMVSGKFGADDRSGAGRVACNRRSFRLSSLHWLVSDLYLASGRPLPGSSHSPRACTGRRGLFFSFFLFLPGLAPAGARARAIPPRVLPASGFVFLFFFAGFPSVRLVIGTIFDP